MNRRTAPRWVVAAALALGTVAPAAAQQVDTIVPGHPKLAGAMPPLGRDSIANFNLANGQRTSASHTIRRVSFARTREGAASLTVQTDWRSARSATTSRNTVVLAVPTLAPLRYSVRATTDSADIHFANGRVTGWVAPAGQPRRELDASAALPPAAALDVLIPLLPLADGYRAFIPTYNPWGGEAGGVPVRVLGSEPVERRGRAWDAWKVEVDRGGHVSTLWISKELRKTLRSHDRLKSGQAEWEEEVHPFYDNTLPSPSPDGTRIAYASDRDGRSQVYVANADGSGERNLSDTPAQASLPDWSPDGRTLAYVTYRLDGRGSEIWVMDANGGGKRLLVGGVERAQNPAWSPRGDLIAFAGGPFPESDVHLVRPDGSGMRKIEIPGPQFWPAWSPDGSRLAVAGFDGQTVRIYVMSADGTGLRELTQGETPAWSPDGARIAFQRRVGEHYRIFTIPAEGGAETQLPAGGGDDEVPVWSRDGLIYYQSSTDGVMNIYAVRPDGTGRRRVLPAPY